MCIHSYINGAYGICTTPSWGCDGGEPCGLFRRAYRECDIETYGAAAPTPRPHIADGAAAAATHSQSPCSVPHRGDGSSPYYGYIEYRM